MPNDLTVNIKMYQVGELGDCFLLHFQDGAKESHVLIDCGSFRNKDASKARLRTIITHIKSQLNDKKLDVVVGTHQHNDHLSGYVHGEDLFTGAIKQVWLSWLDDPKDTLARQINKDQKNLVDKLTAIHMRLRALNMQAGHEAITDVLGFYSVTGGNDPAIPAKGIEILKKIGEKNVMYLSPGQQLDLPGLDSGSVKVYVLGPPRNQSLLFDKDPAKGQSYDPALALATASASKLLSALDNHEDGSDTRQEEEFPFNKSFKKSLSRADADMIRIYDNRKESWRKIDEDWLDQANRLALYLDSYTNNSSLVLAFELVRSGKVLLFA